MSGWLSLLEVAFPWMIVALSALVAGFSIYNWLAAQAAARSYERDLVQWKEAAAVLTRQIEDLVGLVAMSSASAPVSAPASVATSAATMSAPSFLPPDPGRLPATKPPLVDEILSATDSWCSMVGQTPPSVEKLCRRIRASADQDRVDPNRLINDCRDLARAAVAFTDDKGLADGPVQGELSRLVSVAKLKLLSPRIGDEYNPVIHEVVGSNRAPTSQHRNHVSQVVRRGLIDSSAVVEKVVQKVVQKAEVHIYD